MPTLLHLDASPLETSITRELTREFSTTWKAAHPDGTLIYRDLVAEPSAPIDQSWVHAAYTPPMRARRNKRPASDSERAHPGA